MNRQLRKRHRIVWMVLAVLIPFLVIISWLLIPSLEPVKAIVSSQPPALPVVLRTIQRPHYEIELQTDKQGHLQLEWWSKVSLRIPSAVVYQVRENGEQHLIGRIEARGHYRFPLERKDSTGRLQLKLYDFIHEQVIDTINISL